MATLEQLESLKQMQEEVIAPGMVLEGIAADLQRQGFAQKARALRTLLKKLETWRETR